MGYCEKCNKPVVMLTNGLCEACDPIAQLRADLARVTAERDAVAAEHERLRQGWHDALRERDGAIARAEKAEALNKASGFLRARGVLE